MSEIDKPPSIASGCCDWAASANNRCARRRRRGYNLETLILRPELSWFSTAAASVGSHRSASMPEQHSFSCAYTGSSVASERLAGPSANFSLQGLLVIGDPRERQSTEECASLLPSLNTGGLCPMYASCGFHNEAPVPSESPSHKTTSRGGSPHVTMPLVHNMAATPLVGRLCWAVSDRCKASCCSSLGPSPKRRPIVDANVGTWFRWMGTCTSTNDNVHRLCVKRGTCMCASRCSFCAVVHACMHIYGCICTWNLVCLCAAPCKRIEWHTCSCIHSTRACIIMFAFLGKRSALTGA